MVACVCVIIVRAVDMVANKLPCVILCSSDDAVKFREDLMNIARTTLSSKILTQYKDHFAILAVTAVLRLKVGVEHSPTELSCRNLSPELGMFKMFYYNNWFSNSKKNQFFDRQIFVHLCHCLQCFNAVCSAAGRTSGL